MWYFINNGQQEGPFNERQILRFIQEGIITQSTKVWKKGMPDWKSVYDTSLDRYFHSLSDSPILSNRMNFNMSFYPILKKFNDGIFISNFIANFFRALGILAGITGIVLFVEILRITFKSDSTGDIIVGMLIAILVAVAYYAIVQIWFYHARILDREEVKKYPVIASISNLLRIIGENFAILGVVVALGGIIVYWSNINPNSLSQFFLQFYRRSFFGNEFWNGLIYFSINLFYSFFILLICYFLAEIIEVSADIAKGIWKIKQNTNPTHPSEPDPHREGMLTN